MNINTRIYKLECIENKNGMENIILKVHFECTGEETINSLSYSAITQGVSTLEDPEINNFIPYNNVTKEQVVSWIENTRQYQEVIRQLRILIDGMNVPQTILLNPPFNN
jgi:hypothetical protein